MNCLLCGSAELSLLHKIEGIPLRRCGVCGFIAADLSTATVDFRAFYADRYPADAFLAQRPRKLRKAHAELAVAESLLQGRRLLDVGSSYGFFLDVGRQRGWEGTGVEVSRTAATFARQTYGLHVIHGTLDEARLPADSFDLVTIRHVLEHVPDPAGLIAEARRLLAPGGVMLVAVPNMESLAYRLVGRNWWWLDPPTHLWYFSSRTLAVFLARHGLVPVRLATARADDHPLLYTLLFALNQRTGAARRLRRRVGEDSQGGSQLERGGYSGLAAAPRVRRLWEVVTLLGEVVERAASPAVRLVGRAGWGSEVLLIVMRGPAAPKRGLS